MSTLIWSGVFVLSLATLVWASTLLVAAALAQMGVQAVAQ